MVKATVRRYQEYADVFEGNAKSLGLDIFAAKLQTSEDAEMRENDVVGGVETAAKIVAILAFVGLTMLTTMWIWRAFVG